MWCVRVLVKNAILRSKHGIRTEHLIFLHEHQQLRNI